MPALFIGAFIIILGVITLIPTDIGRKVVRETSTLINASTNTPTPTTAPTTPTVQTSPSVSPSPTLKVKPSIPRSDDEGLEDN